MSRVVTQSLFHSNQVKPLWHSYLVSGGVHIGLLVLLLAVTVPVARRLREPQRAVLVAPQLSEYHPKLPTPHYMPPTPRATRIVVPPPPAPIPIVKAPEPKPVERAPVAPVPAPTIQAEAKEISAPVPKPEAPPAPKAEVRTGVFDKAEELAKNTPVPHQLNVGGFGDPNGVVATPNPKSGPVVLAKVGSFDQPAGSGQAGGGSQSPAGGVHQGSFGSAGVSGSQGGTGSSGGGTVKTGAFGNSNAGPAAPKRAQEVAPAVTPVEILFKPQPAYTAEARSLHLEGQVSLRVVFLATGSIRVVRIIHGLGHGLDEAAQQAALQVRFRPATRDGVAVDTSATINITFELA
jgi:TonB family protein